MELLELANILKDMYSNPPNKEQSTMIHLFGVKYATEIKRSGFTPKEIIMAANMPESYQAEINKGIKLSKYVIAK